MNSPEEFDELTELTRLLPADPVERGLPPERHSHHKDLLMQLIDRDAAATPTDTDTAAAPSRSRRPFPPRRLSRPALLAACVAVAVAATLTVGLADGRQEAGRGHSPSAAPDTGGHDGRGTGGRGTGGHGTGGRGAVVTLDRIAAVALRTDVEPVRDSQYVYVRTRVAENEADWRQPVRPGSLHDRETWFSQDREPLTEYGMTRENGEDYPIRILVPEGSAGEAAGIDRPTYAWLASLPTDPAALLRRVYAETPVEDGEDRDQAVFDRIGGLVREQVMPSATAAAIYRATARIPGVTEVDDAVDAAGRHGIAIAREDTRMGLRTEWIFDPGTLEYLGERTVLSRNSAMGTAGTVFDTRAVLERAVVDRRGQEPGGSQGPGGGSR
ncbi:CU044_5270 family protein [Streptomyces sp. FL07-04A]|uniref:CU044_5270 family protein n=1 Tax=Streptomyces sp. FL07-04A TaxID=3028658 RepID=UPI0029A09B97|nr:CU044_5270 family protein [Streptomyces sp. FL07-04A]MDX3576177.1 CU044_5270 family protein [Streptomyces sp. FL07-04A]